MTRVTFKNKRKGKDPKQFFHHGPCKFYVKDCVFGCVWNDFLVYFQ